MSEEYKTQNSDSLIPLSKYIRSGQNPVNMRWAIQVYGSQLEAHGAIIRYGNRWLVCERALLNWIRLNGKSNSGYGKSN